MYRSICLSISCSNQKHRHRDTTCPNQLNQGRSCKNIRQQSQQQRKRKNIDIETSNKTLWQTTSATINRHSRVWPAHATTRSNKQNSKLLDQRRTSTWLLSIDDITWTRHWRPVCIKIDNHQNSGQTGPHQIWTQVGHDASVMNGQQAQTTTWHQSDRPTNLTKKNHTTDTLTKMKKTTNKPSRIEQHQCQNNQQNKGSRNTTQPTNLRDHGVPSAYRDVADHMNTHSKAADPSSKSISHSSKKLRISTQHRYDSHGHQNNFLSGSIGFQQSNRNGPPCQQHHRLHHGTGRTSPMVQGDNEPILQALGETVASKIRGIQTRHSPAYSSQSQASIERLHRTLFGQARVTREQMEPTMGLLVGMQRPVMAYLIKHSVFFINNYLIHSDGTFF